MTRVLTLTFCWIGEQNQHISHILIKFQVDFLHISGIQNNTFVNLHTKRQDVVKHPALQ